VGDDEEEDPSFLQVTDTTVLRPKALKSTKGGRFSHIFHTARKTVGELTRSISDGGKDPSKNQSTSTGLRAKGLPPPPLNLENTDLGEKTRYEDAQDGRNTPLLPQLNKDDIVRLMDELLARNAEQIRRESAEALVEAEKRITDRGSVTAHALVENLGRKLREEICDLNRKFAEDLRELMRTELSRTALEVCTKAAQRGAPPQGTEDPPPPRIKEERTDQRPRETRVGFEGRHTQSLADVRYDDPGRDTHRRAYYDPPPRQFRDGSESTLHLWREEWDRAPPPTTSVWANRGYAPRNNGSQRSGNSFDSGRHYCGGQKIKTFSGGNDDYLTWRQSLFRTLERLQYRDPKDEAQYLYDHLGGQAQSYVTHLYYPLTDDSYRVMLRHLDRLYGEEQMTDRVRIDKIYALPKIAEFTKDNLANMIAVIETAVDPLSRLDPTALTSNQSRELRKLRGLLPAIQQELFISFCDNNDRPINMRSLVAFLYKAFDARKADSGGLGKAQKGSRRSTEETPRGRRTRVREERQKTLLNLERSSVSSEGEVVPVLATQERKCPMCEGGHTLGYCPKFKNMAYTERMEAVRTYKVCMCCLKVGHIIRTCRAVKVCTVEGCKRKHHPLLHNDDIAKVLYCEQGGDDSASPDSSSLSSERH